LQYQNHIDADTAFAAKRVLRLVPDLGGDRLLLLPDEAIFQRAREQHFASGGYFDSLFAYTDIPADGLITPEVGDPILMQVLRNIGSDYKPVDSPNALWGVVHTEHAVARPAEYALTRIAFMGVVSHEIGSHLLEHINGLRQPLRLLGLGLRGTERGNEGRAFSREQIIFSDVAAFEKNSFWWRYNIALHFAISCGAGLLGEPYGFIKVEEALRSICTLWAKTRPAGHRLEASKRPADLAWHLAARALLGTDGTGGAYLRNIVYLEGAVGCWQAEQDDPGAIRRGDIGKHDITNPKHLSVLAGLSIIDASHMSRNLTTVSMRL
jgi:hypothetical protein